MLMPMFFVPFDGYLILAAAAGVWIVRHYHWHNPTVRRLHHIVNRDRARWLVLLLAVTLANCGGSNSPTSPTPDPTPTPTTYSLSGTVTNASNGQGVSGATIQIMDGPNAGLRATANGSGQYTFSSLQRAGFTANASATYFTPQSQGVNLVANVTQNFALQFIPPWSRGGIGDFVFDMPRISRVRITGDYTQCCSNFIVHIAGEHVVNELIGRDYGATHFEGTYVTSGGTVEITHSSGVQWAFFEVR